jgi:hypothetical protein
MKDPDFAIAFVLKHAYRCADKAYEKCDFRADQIEQADWWKMH